MQSNFVDSFLQLKVLIGIKIMVAEALTTRLARERLAALKKYIPVRNDLRDCFESEIYKTFD